MRGVRHTIILAVAMLMGLLVAVGPQAVAQIGLPGSTTTVTTPTVTLPHTTTSSTTTTSTTSTTTTSTTTTPSGGSDDDDVGFSPRVGLALGVTTPIGALAPFAPGRTATASGVLAITSAGAWSLAVSDAGGNGHLMRGGGCSTGVTELAAPLSVSATPLAGSSAGATSLSSSSQAVASGSATTTATTNVSQTIGATEAVATGCTYSATVTYTLS